MPIFDDKVQDVVCAGGFCCFFIGPNRDDADLFALNLRGQVWESATLSAAVALIMSARLNGNRLRVETNASNRIVRISADSQRVVIDTPSVSDDFPYASRAHLHDGRYPQIGHNHDGVYSPVGHGHPNYADIAHNHDHDALANFERDEHTLALQMTQFPLNILNGTPLTQLVMTDPTYDGLLAPLRAELGGGPDFLTPYLGRNAVVSLYATVFTDGTETTIFKLLNCSMVRDTAAADLRWNLRLEDPATGAAYTNPGTAPGNLRRTRLTLVTHLNAA